MSFSTKCHGAIDWEFSDSLPPQRVAAAVVYRRDSWRWDVLNRATHTNNLPLKKETEKVGLGQILLVLLASIFI